MAELTTSIGIGERSHTQFYVWMATALVLVAFGGFSVTYFVPMAAGTVRELTPVVHIHGVLFFSWTLFLLLQTWLVAEGRTPRHRAVGMVGISLATAMVIFGFIVSLYASARRFNAGDMSNVYYGLLLGWSSMVIFAALVGSAIASIRNSDVHKRLMLLATIGIVGAAVARMYVPFFGGSGLDVPHWLTNGTVDVLIVALLVYDWRTLGKPHNATLAGAALLVGAQILRGPVSETELWQSTAQTLFAMIA